MQRLILLVDDRVHSRDLVATELTEAGFGVRCAEDGDEGWTTFQEHEFDLVVTDLRMPRSDGMTLLQRIRSPASINPQTPVIMVSAHGSLSVAAAAGRRGATDFLPLSDEGIEQLLVRVTSILSEDPGAEPVALAGENRVIQRARERVAAVADLHAPVLIHGERGCGRGEVAHYLHRLSRASGDSIRHLACGQIEVLGEVPTAGTLYLEDVDLVSPEVRWEIWERLPILEGQREASGLRVIASSTANLEALAEAGKFHRDLAKWLSRFVIELPPLRERIADLDALVERLLPRVAERIGRDQRRIPEGAMARIREHPWSGNLAELEKCLENILAFAKGKEVFESLVDSALAELEQPLLRIESQRAREEREDLLALYRKHGTYAGVARELGVTRNAAKYRFGKHGLLPARGAVTRT